MTERVAEKTAYCQILIEGCVNIYIYIYIHIYIYNGLHISEHLSEVRNQMI